jgi:predicted nucleotidyltransferase
MTRQEALQRLAAHKYKLAEFSVRNLSIFGSVARDEAGTESDIDILVEYEPGACVGLFAFIRLQRFLSELLETRVDLVTPAALRPEMKEQILREAIRAA